jgi:hypothetical protein
MADILADAAHPADDGEETVAVVVSLKDAARALGISESGVRKRLARGQRFRCAVAVDGDLQKARLTVERLNAELAAGIQRNCKITAFYGDGVEHVG